ncbi:MAG: RagB/SusD family nutrient uptake outer membrane protein [Algibacter sp.]
MKINNIKRIIFLSLVILTIGCDDADFLDTPPETFLTVDNVFTSGAQVDQILITMYQQDRELHSKVDAAWGRVMHGQGTDLITVPTFRQNTNFSDYNSTFTPRADRLNTIYSELYQMISRANLVLSLTEREDIAFESEAIRTYIIAQAKFFRAKAHGEAAQFFGRVAIEDEPTTQVRFDYEQSERAEIYQFAIDDLESILNDLPVTTSEPGRVVRGAAQHYLSEFYLGVGVENNDDNAYDQAIKYASDIIDGGTYSLMQSRFGSRASEPGKNVYWDLFRLGNQNYADGNTESIWVYQYNYEAFKGGDDARLRYPYYFSPVWRAIPGVVGENEYTGGRGIAIFRPTDLMENIIWESSISDGDIRGDESNIRRTVFYNDPTFPESAPGSLLGQEVPMADLLLANDGLADGAYFPIFEKLTTDQFEGVEDGRRMEDLWRGRYAVRLPSTILLRAEAYLRKGDNQSAADDINMIRERSQCNVLATAGMVDIDFILDERARELYVEENRWATLLRMGGNVASDRIRRYARYDYQVNSLTFDFNTFPIPQTVIDRNKDVVWEQNPGWENR